MQKDKDKNKKKQATQFLECIENKVARYFIKTEYDEDGNEIVDPEKKLITSRRIKKSAIKDKQDKEEDVDELMPLLRKYAQKLQADYMMGYIVYQFCSIRKEMDKLKSLLRTLKSADARSAIEEQITKKQRLSDSCLASIKIYNVVV